ncbi:MAG: phosphoenolpyruvate--protein phosphotransferase [Acidobacteria bacterium]|nr:phosphoenolpyruvate--protein phosphotransferase [Acidobacteriota bacterium]MCA1642410.1 phosphoenolpyruvate--protein phosphotransferase [Acidobacteriota bacterium]
MSGGRKNGRREKFWRGVGVSDGAAVGRVLRVGGAERQNVYRATLEAADVKREIRRFHAAVRLSRRQLVAVRRRAEQLLGAEHAYIFDAHLLMLEDRKLIDEVEDYVRSERANAEWAVKVVGDRLLSVYAEINDDYLRERGSDVEDVLRRLLVALGGEHAPRGLTEDAVLVAEELLPSAVADLDFAHVRAVVSDAGGWTSHTAIIARGLGIPAVVGLRDFYRHARTGDEIAVDATRGEVVLRPSKETAAKFREASSRARSTVAAPAAPAGAAHAPTHTRDGVEIVLRANVELPAEYEGVRRYGARGVGLYRTEFLFAQGGGAPTEDEQFAAYAELARLCGADGARVRLFDLGGDKLLGGGETAERNPALGLRAIRLCLRREDVMRAQARAVLRAAACGRLDLVLPMISDVSEVRRARRIVDEERERLTGEGIEAGAVRVGAMIEVPSAVFVADALAREVDFFSLGTNDLVQYTLAVDRGNDEVADWFRSLHPAVLQSISRVLGAAGGAGIPCVVCGEMAGTPAYAAVLVGLGARELSMTATAIPRVRHALSGIDAAGASEIARECMACAGADESEEVVRARLGERWGDIFPPKSLPPPKGEGYNFGQVGHTATTKP